jgi:hypothetical protein
MIRRRASPKLASDYTKLSIVVRSWSLKAVAVKYFGVTVMDRWIRVVRLSRVVAAIRRLPLGIALGDALGPALGDALGTALGDAL